MAADEADEPGEARKARRDAFMQKKDTVERFVESPKAKRKSTGFTLDDWEVEYAKEVFEAYDTDKSGIIDMTELKELLAEAQWVVDMKTVDAFIEKFLGSAKDVDLDSFLKLYKVMSQRQPFSARKFKAKRRLDVSDLRLLESNTRATFEEFDKEKKGYLSERDLCLVMEHDGMPDLDGDDYEAIVSDRMKWADGNKDGQIDFEVFVWYRNAIVWNFFADKEEQKTKFVSNQEDPWDPTFFAN